MEKTLCKVASILCLSLVLAACGGGGGGGGGASTPSLTSPQNTLDTVIQAAAKNDNNAVAANFTVAAQQKYKQHFSDIAKMRDFGESLAKAEQIDIKDNFAIYKSTYVENGKTYTYFIHLIKDDKGVWRLDTF